MQSQKTFGETVKQLREKRRLPLRTVADFLGIDTSMLGKIEKNNRKPTEALIEKCACFFEVPKKELMIAFLSDAIAYQMQDAEDAGRVLKVAEQKIQYLKSHKKS